MGPFPHDIAPHADGPETLPPSPVHRGLDQRRSDPLASASLVDDHSDDLREGIVRDPPGPDDLDPADRRPILAFRHQDGTVGTVQDIAEPRLGLLLAGGVSELRGEDGDRRGVFETGGAEDHALESAQNYAASSFTPEMNSRSVFLASPSTIIVFGWMKRSFSIPAKPVFMLRLSTMVARVSSALNTGMP